MLISRGHCDFISDLWDGCIESLTNPILKGRIDPLGIWRLRKIIESNFAVAYP